MTGQLPDKLGRHSIRLKGYDYSQGGGYFFTIVTYGRDCILGKINDGEMHVNALGRIVQECWNDIPSHFPNAGIDAFIIMPNHVHGIMFLFDNPGRGTIYRAPTGVNRAPTGINRTPTRTEQIEQFGKPTFGSLPTIIRTFKAAVTRCAGRELYLVNIWQRNYYEHILRNQEDYERIAGYILDNPLNWADDEEYPLKHTV